VTGPHEVAIVVTLLDDKSLATEELAEAVAAAIAAGFATHLMIPGPPGHTSCGIFLNEVLDTPARRSNTQIILRCLAQLRAAALANMSRVEPVILDGIKDEISPGHTAAS